VDPAAVGMVRLTFEAPGESHYFKEVKEDPVASPEMKVTATEASVEVEAVVNQGVVAVVTLVNRNMKINI